MYALVVQGLLAKGGKHERRVPNMQGGSFAMAAAAKQRAINNKRGAQIPHICDVHARW